MNKLIRKNHLFLMSGPCVIEDKDELFFIADSLKNTCTKLGVDLIFKASFDKANRTSIKSFRGPGLEKGLKILEAVKKEFSLPIVTDIHESSQAQEVSKVADVLQIPAFLCRQTDLLVASAKTKSVVNVKKAQFLSHADMAHVVQKLKDSGAADIMLTERGTMLGYSNLVVDFRNIIEMKKLGIPVIMDATHSTQYMGGSSGVSGGNPEYAPYLAKCAISCGADGLFFEVHKDPSKALSDGSNMIKLANFEKILKELKDLFDFTQAQRSL